MLFGSHTRCALLGCHSVCHWIRAQRGLLGYVLGGGHTGKRGEPSVQTPLRRDCLPEAVRTTGSVSPLTSSSVAAWEHGTLTNPAKQAFASKARAQRERAKADLVCRDELQL